MLMALSHVRAVRKAASDPTGVVVDADYGSNANVPRGPQTVGTPLRRRQSRAGDVLDHRGETGTTGDRDRRRASKAHAERWLLCERWAADVRKFYLLTLDTTTRLKDLVAMARARWPIEQQYRELKDEPGLDHFEGRSYRGWTHHVVLTAIAFTFLQLERGRADGDAPRPTLPVVHEWVREVVGLLYLIHNDRLLSTLDDFRKSPPLRR